MKKVTYICPPDQREHVAGGLMHAVVMQFATAFGGATEASITLPDGTGFVFTIHEEELVSDRR